MLQDVDERLDPARRQGERTGRAITERGAPRCRGVGPGSALDCVEASLIVISVHSCRIFAGSWAPYVQWYSESRGVFLRSVGRGCTLFDFAVGTRGSPRSS